MNALLACTRGALADGGIEVKSIGDWFRMAKAGSYLREVVVYWRLSGYPRDFVRLMRVRLSLSKLGWLACPTKITTSIRLHGFGEAVQMRSHSTDVSVLKEMVVSHGYDEVFRHLTREPKVIVDLGANIGLVSSWFLSRYPQARVVAVEPEQGNIVLLRKNVGQFNGRARVVPACIGANPRRVQLVSNTGEWGYHMEEANGLTKAGAADVVTMAQALGQFTGDIDLLKCDIEGAEQELFEQCADWIGRVRLALVECHGDYGAKDLMESIRRCGGRFETVHCTRNATYRLETVILKRIE